MLRRGDLESGEADLATGLLVRGLYRVGWLRCGPRGIIPENRADAKMVADAIAHTVETGGILVGKPGAAALGGRISVESAVQTRTTRRGPALPGGPGSTAAATRRRALRDEGIHLCMGAPLARLATKVAMETLIDGTELRIVGMPERWVKQMVRGFSRHPINFMN